MLFDLQLLHCILSILKEFILSLSHLYLLATLSHLSAVLDFKLSLTEQRTYHTAVQVFVKLLPRNSMICFPML